MPRTLALALLLCSAAAARAGGTRADYERADRIAREVRGKVVGATLDAVWVGPGDLITIPPDLMHSIRPLGHVPIRSLAVGIGPKDTV